MGYFDDAKHVRDYIEMARGFDGRNLIEKMSEHLPEGSTVLEIGMGPGVDLDILGAFYTATGSDSSNVFLELYREKHSDADLLILDAVTLATDRRFDAIYSNKVLHHLSRAEFSTSISRQLEVVNSGGILCHSFWRGSGEESIEGMRFTYYQESELRKLVEPYGQIVELSPYREMNDADSILLILRVP